MAESRRMYLFRMGKGCQTEAQAKHHTEINLIYLERRFQLKLNLIQIVLTDKGLLRKDTALTSDIE